MARRGENIHKRKDGRWEGRYIKARTPDRRICWGYIYGTTYAEVKQRLIHKKSEYGGFQLIDDDTLYPESWLLDLIKTYIKYPNCVCCYRAHKMVLNGEVITPYSDWIGLSPDEMGPDMLLVPIGVGGVLYPPKYFDNVDFDYEKIKELCPTADDLWLKALGIVNGYKAVKVYPNSKEWFTIVSSQKQALMKTNVGSSMNDISIFNLQRYYKIKI